MTDTDISNYLYTKSTEIEPRGCKQIPKFPRKYPSLSLKSPSTKAKNSRASVSSNSSTIFTQPLVKNEEVKSEEPSKSDNDFSVFAHVRFVFIFILAPFVVRNLFRLG